MIQNRKDAKKMNNKLWQSFEPKLYNIIYIILKASTHRKVSASSKKKRN